MDKWKEALRRGLSGAGVLLLADVGRQRLWILSRGQVRARYAISTARKGTGQRENSLQTPTGWHRVARRIGKGRRRGSVFIARRFTGDVLPRNEWRSKGGRDLILTRIVWLQGLEPGFNRGPGCDSYARYIYLHGTNQEQRLGRPASHGCIRLGNDDMARVFNRIRGREAWCWIGYLSDPPARRRA